MPLLRFEVRTACDNRWKEPAYQAQLVTGGGTLRCLGFGPSKHAALWALRDFANGYCIKLATGSPEDPGSLRRNESVRVRVLDPTDLPAANAAIDAALEGLASRPSPEPCV